MEERRNCQSGSRKKSRVVCVFLAGLLGSFVPSESRTVPEPALREAGVVVEEVGRGSALARAGIRPGDVLLSWKRPPSPPASPEGDRGEIGSVFDWLWLVIEQAPRGKVEITGEREGKRQDFDLALGAWRAKVRPRLPEGMLAEYLKGRELIAAGQLEEATSLWQKVADAAEESGGWRLRCGLHLRMGETYSSWASPALR